MPSFSPSDVRRCLDQARHIAEHYRQYHIVGDHDHRSIIDLMEIVETYLQKRFVVRKMGFFKDSVSAMFWARDDDTYEVFVLDGLDEQSRRFALCKELFHIILDEDECHSVNVSAHVEEVNATFPVADSKLSSSAAWEMLAEAAAMEFMFSYAERERFLEAAKGSQTGPDYAAAARRYGVPEFYVQAYCSAPYMEFFGAFRA